MWKQSYAIYCDYRYGPFFGAGHDFIFYCGSDKKGYSNINSNSRSYNIPKGEASSLAGVATGNFDILEVEVYQIIF